MKNILTNLKARFNRDDTAATAVEYSLVIGLISMILVATVTTLDVPIQDFVDNIGNQLMSNL